MTGSSFTSGCTAVPLTELKFPPANRFVPSVVSAHTSVGLLLLICVVPATLATKLFRRLPLARQKAARLARASLPGARPRSRTCHRRRRRHR